MSAQERDAARGMIEKAELGRTPEEQRAGFDERFANLPLGDGVKLVERTVGGVPALDDLERAIQAAGLDPEGDSEDGLAHGVLLVFRSLREGLKRSGIEAVDPKGEKFDPNQHEALSTLPVEGTESGVVVEVMQKGYRFGFQSSSDHVSTHWSYAVVLSEIMRRTPLSWGCRGRKHDYCGQVGTSSVDYNCDSVFFTDQRKRRREVV